MNIFILFFIIEMTKVLLSEIVCSDFKGSKQLHKQVYEKTIKKEIKQIEVLKYIEFEEKLIPDNLLPQVRNFVRSELKKDDKNDLNQALKNLLMKEEVTVVDLKNVIKNNSEEVDISELQKEVYDKFNLSLTTRQIKSLLII